MCKVVRTHYITSALSTGSEWQAVVNNLTTWEESESFPPCLRIRPVNEWLNDFRSEADALVAMITGGGTSTVPTDYHIVSTAAPFSLNVWESGAGAFGMVMGNGLTELQEHADTMEAVDERLTGTDVEGDSCSTAPTQLASEQNYPNPFNPSTSISYTIARSKEFGVGGKEMKLVVCDVLGREVAVLVNEKKAPGKYDVTVDASGLASGVYFYRLEVEGYVQSRRMIFLK
jgi:hypothetical protein